MIDRRDFLRYSLTAAGGVFLSTAMGGCVTPASRDALSMANFDYGVASGDPVADGVLLWTRATPAEGAGPVRLAWEVARDEGFATVLRRGEASTDADRDYTVKVDVRDLEPGRVYFYRFLSADADSAVGRTRTLPVGATERVRLAVFSCSNYPAGYFYPYREASRRDDIDAFLHLGDYFYEYGDGGYATERATELGRELPEDNAGELFTLADYRKRYALYRSDTDLQALHAAAPMIAVWDDHEIANDAWSGGAQNHGPDEGDYQARRTAAVQAYFEWLPLRPVTPDAEGRIYRSFDFGDLLSLHMLDTRLLGRDEQIDYADFRDRESGALDMPALAEALGDPTRSLLGEEQRAWLAAHLQHSPGRWQVLGQQTLITRMHLPAEILETLFARRDFAAAAGVIAELTELAAAEQAGTSLSEAQRRRLRMALPYNLDAWDGYAAERERLYAMAADSGRPLVVLSGDTHNAWYSELRDAQGHSRGVEIATPGVSSPGMESYLRLDADAAQHLERSLTVLIEELRYCELRQRGYLEVEFSANAVHSTWHFVSDVTSEDFVGSTHREVFAHAQAVPAAAAG